MNKHWNSLKSANAQHTLTFVPHIWCEFFLKVAHCTRNHFTPPSLNQRRKKMLSKDKSSFAKCNILKGCIKLCWICMTSSISTNSLQFITCAFKVCLSAHKHMFWPFSVWSIVLQIWVNFLYLKMTFEHFLSFYNTLFGSNIQSIRCNCQRLFRTNKCHMPLSWN